jgi:hypothetical protein
LQSAVRSVNNIFLAPPFLDPAPTYPTVFSQQPEARSQKLEAEIVMSNKIDLSLFRGDDSEDEIDLLPVKVS